MADKKKNVANGVMKAASILVILNCVSSVLSFVRQIILTGIFGMSESFEMDAYNAAFTIPDTLYILLVGGGLSSSFIPVFSGYIAAHKEEDGYKMASSILNLVAISAALFSLLGIIFTPQVLPLVTDFKNWQQEGIDLAITLTRIMFFQCFFMCLAGICQGILQSYKDFAPPSIGAVLYSFIIISFGYLLYKLGAGIAGFSIGVVVGAFVNFAYQIYPMKKHGFKYKKIVDLDHEGVKQFFKLFWPMLFGISVSQLNQVVNGRFASGINQGILTSVREAQRIQELPITIFASSVALSIFPTMVEHFTNDDMNSFRASLSMGIRNVVFILLPCSVGIIAVRQPLIRLLYRNGATTENDVRITAGILAFYCIGMAAYSVRKVVLQGFYAVKETKTPVRINVFIFMLNTLLTYIFAKIWKGNGIALAYSVTGLCSVTLQTFFLKRKIGSINGHEIKDSVLKCAICCAVMYVVVQAGQIIFENNISYETKSNQILEFLILVAAGGGTFVAMALALKMKEMTSILDVFMRKFLKRRIKDAL
ncbi:MAG: murein biosynthesis integral membrane protein MurJ [Eubacterium sp.]|nr:murein biosynthesis integral membrane protein MurJ [Eubacterium sp.]